MDEIDKQQIMIERGSVTACPRCHGSGAPQWAQDVACDDCGGLGGVDAWGAPALWRRT